MKKSLFFAVGGIACAASMFAGTKEGLEMLDAGDLAGAAAEFQAAYQEGDGDGAFYLGRMFEVGAGTEADPLRAANLYAARVGTQSGLSMPRLGVMSLEGKVLLRDYTESARLFCQAADLGDANGQFNCGLAYQGGRGVDADVNKTIEYWTLASDQGNIAATNLLGQLYLQGEDVDQDLEKAKAFFEKSADAGNAMGLFELGSYYAGLEEPNNVEAYKFASLSAVRGHPESIGLMNDLEAEMTAEEITSAQQAAKEWTQSRVAQASASE